VFPLSKFLFADHSVFRVWRSERCLLGLDLFPQNGFSGGRGDEAEEGWGWIERPAAEFGVGLQSNEEGVVCQKAESGVLGVSMTNKYVYWRLTAKFKELHSLSLFVFAYEFQPALFKTINVVGVNLISMAMSFPYLPGTAVKLASLRPLLAGGAKHGRAQAEPHGTAHMRFGNFRHEYHDGVPGLIIELGRCRTWLVIPNEVRQSTRYAKGTERRKIQQKRVRQPNRRDLGTPRH
jgi:hypothetical protein